MSDGYLSHSDFDYWSQLEIDSPTSLRLNEEIESWTNAPATQEMALDNYLMFGRDVEEAYDFHYHYDLAVSNSCRTILKNQQ